MRLLQRGLELRFRFCYLVHKLPVVLVYLVDIVLVLQVLCLYVLRVLHIALSSDGVRRPGLRRRHICRELTQLPSEGVEHLLFRIQLCLESNFRLVELLLVHYIFCLLLCVQPLDFYILLLN